jgi:hypothetical protein
LRRLLRGELSEVEAMALEGHFATCPHCARRAEELEGEAVPLQVPEQDWPRGEVINRLMSRLEALSVSGVQGNTGLDDQLTGPDLSHPPSGPAALPQVPGYEVLQELWCGAWPSTPTANSPSAAATTVSSAFGTPLPCASRPP